MEQKTDIERIEECLYCEYWEYCCVNVPHPKDNPDGTCLTKEILSMKGGSDVKSRTS